MFDSIDFPKAVAVERGCGEREPGGVYVECGLSPYGSPLERFLIDPPQPLPAGLDIVNKPQLWTRVNPLTGDEILDPDTQEPVVDLLIWVGEAFYPYCADYIEEVQRWGASRKLNPNLDLARLTRSSHMILAHPRALNSLWEEQTLPDSCEKHVPGHDASALRLRSLNGALDPPRKTGPCLFKVWELIPAEAAKEVLTLAGARPLCLREIGSTVYQYRPTGESVEGLAPGIFAALPITGFALIRFADGSLNERAKEKVLAGRESHGDNAIPFYETDR
jgi:hypothetical protein